MTWQLLEFRKGSVHENVRGELPAQTDPPVFEKKGVVSGRHFDLRTQKTEPVYP